MNVTDEHERHTGLAYVANSAVRADTERAERSARQMLDSGCTGPVYYAGLVAAFALQPGGLPRAARLVTGIEDPVVRDRVLSDAANGPHGFAVRHVLVDPMQPGKPQEQLRRRIAKDPLWSSAQPLSTLLSLPEAASDPAGRLHDVGMIAYNMADRRDVELPQALELLDRAIDAVEDSAARAAALDEPAFSSADVAPAVGVRLLPYLRDPESICAVSQVLAEKLAPLDPDRAEQIAMSIDDRDQREWALMEFAGALAPRDPDRADGIVAQITDPTTRSLAQSAMTRALATLDPDRAERLAVLIEDDEEKEHALYDLAHSCAPHDLERGLRIAGLITDPERGADALEAIALIVAETDAVRAEQIIATIGLPEKTDWARRFIAGVLAGVDPTAAERIAAAVIDPALRAEAWTGPAQAWLQGS